MADSSAGLMIGQPQAAEAGLAVLASGGNAVDAAVTGALVAGTVALLSSGIGGYGGHMVIGWRNGKVRVIDFNTIAPAVLPSPVTMYGWKSVGVPATLAGLDLAAHRYGTRSFRQCLGPAIKYAAEGFELPAALGKSIQNLWPEHFSKDPGAAKLLSRDGKPLGPGERFANPDLAKLLEELAKDDSAESFYRGALARKLAAEFARNGGTVTAADLAAYRAREVEPIEWRHEEWRVVTAPLTAGGLTSVQALRALAACGGTVKPGSEGWNHARLEALRIAWKDRLTVLGDPAVSKIPSAKLLSEATASAASKRIVQAVTARRALDIETKPVEAGGTTHLSVIDREGNMVSVTLTHGDGFGARVAANGLGLLLGHGLSRFEHTDGHVNAPAPRKKPLHNMCPAVAYKAGKPAMAVGGTGGRRIPNAVFDVLSRVLLEGATLKAAVDAPRMNTTGGRELALTGKWSEAEESAFRALGFEVKREAAAIVQAAALLPVRETAAG